MNVQTAKFEQICPREEIALYLDGELSPREEIVLEKHFAVCQICLEELNSQKEMLLALDFAFEKETEIELPKDFTKVVVVKAESGVNGLRSKKERSSALFLCSALFLLIMLGLGTETDRVFGAVSVFINQFMAIVGFTFRLIIDVATGIAVVLRCLSQQIVYSPMFLYVLLFGGLAISAFMFSRLWLRFSRS